MIIEVKKFGKILTSREAGSEAYLAFSPTLKKLKKNEKIQINFEGVSVLAPSWADEFLRPILFHHGKNVSFINDDNPSVKEALKFANPNLDLSRIILFEKEVYFEESMPKRAESGWQTPFLFPFRDEDAIQLLKNSSVKKIKIKPTQNLSHKRLQSFQEMLNKGGIENSLDDGHQIS